jgi:hypothetical protein
MAVTILSLDYRLYMSFSLEKDPAQLLLEKYVSEIHGEEGKLSGLVIPNTNDYEDDDYSAEEGDNLNIDQDKAKKKKRKKRKKKNKNKDNHEGGGKVPLKMNINKSEL